MFTSVDAETGAWEEAMDLVRRGEFADAKTALKAVADDGPLAGVATFYRTWIDRWLAEPPVDWDGIVTLESK